MSNIYSCFSSLSSHKDALKEAFLMKFIFLISNSLVFYLWLISTWAAPLETGDFIFVDLDCGPICEAIEDVTLQQFGKENPRLSHVGILERIGNEFFVWEAWPEGGVVATSLKNFLNRKNSKNYLASVSPNFRSEAQRAIEFIKSKKGFPYNSSFLNNENSYYCSQLLQAALPEFFALLPMYFGTPSDKNYTAWISYFQSLGISVPQGQLGVSPLGILKMGMNTNLFDSPLILIEKDS